MLRISYIYSLSKCLLKISNFFISSNNLIDQKYVQKVAFLCFPSYADLWIILTFLQYPVLVTRTGSFD